MQHIDPRISLLNRVNGQNVPDNKETDLLFYYSSYMYIFDNFCKPEQNVRDCIMSYKGNPNGMRYKMYFGFSSFFKSQIITTSITAFNFSVFMIGLWAYFRNRALDIESLFPLGLTAASLHLFEVSDQICDEYPQYLALVNAFVNGERDYERLWTQFRLAPGLVYQYLPLYALHMVTDFAEHLVKFLHQILH